MIPAKLQGKAIRIGELAQMAGITVRAVRYYEELGLLERSVRGEAKHRRYNHRDLHYLRRIQQLKSYGLTLGEIKEIIDLHNEDPSGEKSRLMLLTRYQEKRDEALQRKSKIEQYIDELNWHIDQLRRVHNFQACPGEECRNCDYTGICKFADSRRESQ